MNVIFLFEEYSTTMENTISKSRTTFEQKHGQFIILWIKISVHLPREVIRMSSLAKGHRYKKY